MSRPLRTAALAALVLAGAPAHAADQRAEPPAPASTLDHRADVFAGYSMAQADASFHGGEMAVAWYFGRALGLAADVDARKATVEGENVTTSSALIGPRFRLRAGGVTPFAHALVGAVRRENGVSIFGVDISESETDLGGALGGGLDVRFAQRWAVRAQADWRFARTASADGGTSFEGDPRLALGVVLRLRVR